MFKTFKINFGGAKSDCCSIKIQEVENNQDEQHNESKDCCQVNIETKKDCCG